MHEFKPRKRRRWPWAVVGVVAAAAAAGYASSAYFSRATFDIVPVIIPVSTNTTVVASKSAASSTIAYETARFDASASASVPAINGPYVSTKATGTVTVYNAYSGQSQRLIAGTRLSNDSGLVYRLTGSVVVPGYTTPKGSIIPGAVSTTIVADQPGPDYNISKSDSLSDFRIVAYKGTPKYQGFYARLASDFTGGFTGNRKTVNPSVLASTTANLKAAIAAELLAKAKAAVPAGYVMYDKGYTLSFPAPSVNGTTADTATVTLSGTLYGVMFKETDLVKKLAPDATAKFDGSAYTTPGLASLSFTIANQSDFSPARGSTLIARLKGDFALVGTVPTEELKRKVAGLRLSETKKVLEFYGAVIDVTKSSGELFPSWASSVPTDQNRITVVINDH